jgi:hypothetical protein
MPTHAHVFHYGAGILERPILDGEMVLGAMATHRLARQLELRQNPVKAVLGEPGQYRVPHIGLAIVTFWL